MSDDPIVAEVRKAREEYAARFNHDFDAMIRDLQEKTRKSGRRVVSLPPRRVPFEKTTPPELEQPGHTLDELVRGITDQNCHGEVDFGPPPGGRCSEA